MSVRGEIRILSARRVGSGRGSYRLQAFDMSTLWEGLEVGGGFETVRLGQGARVGQRESVHWVTPRRLPGKEQQESARRPQRKG